MKLSHGVIGNTSVFGTEESRFEPWWDNKKNIKTPVNIEFTGVFLFIGANIGANWNASEHSSFIVFQTLSSRFNINLD